jgi:hypothetical protein
MDCREHPPKDGRGKVNTCAGQEANHMLEQEQGGNPLVTQQLLTPYQSQYYAWLLTRRAASDTVESLASTLVDSQVDLNPHQVEAALFACTNPLSRGVILADEVGLGKTIEAGLVISQRWAERRRRLLIIVPANLRKQWHQELQDKFNLQSLILEAKNYNTIRKQENQNPFLMPSGPVICSYQFARPRLPTSRTSLGLWSCSTKRIGCAMSTRQATSSPKRSKKPWRTFIPRCC